MCVRAVIYPVHKAFFVFIDFIDTASANRRSAAALQPAGLTLLSDTPITTSSTSLLVARECGHRKPILNFNHSICIFRLFEFHDGRGCQVAEAANSRGTLELNLQFD